MIIISLQKNKYKKTLQSAYVTFENEGFIGGLFFNISRL